MTKKILYLKTDIMFKELIAGGSVTHTLGVLKGLTDTGHSVVIAASSMVQLLKKEYQERVYVLRNPGIIGWCKWKINCLASNIFFLPALMRITKHHTFDGIYQRYSPYNCVGVLLSRITKIPLILEFNGSEVWVEQQWNSKTSSRFFLWLLAWIERYNIDNAQSIVVVSNALKDSLVAQGIANNKIVVAPNGVDVELLNPTRLQSERTTIRRDLHIESKIVLGFIGTFGPWHGISTLQAILPVLLKKHANLHCILIGDGPGLGALKASLNKYNVSITYTGLLDSAQAHVYLAACDMFISPTLPNTDGSRFFGSPTKIFEYMSLAKPIIASDLEQLCEIIKPCLTVHAQHGIGILVPPTDMQGFINAVEYIFGLTAEQRAVIGLRAREKVIQQYTWKTHTQKIIDHVFQKELLHARP